MTKIFTRRAALAFFCLAGLALMASIQSAALPALAADKSQIHVAGAWARPSIGNLDRSAAYFEIMNHGKTADRLVSVKTGISAKAELHATITENDVVRMRALEDGIEVPAGGMVTFAPAGNHVMLVGLKKPLKEGASFPMTLVFEKAGEVTVDVAVKKNAAPDTGGHMHHKH